MDTAIGALIGAAIFLAFVIGLAVSIGSLPLAVIVAFVSALMLFDFAQAAREAVQKRKNGNSN